MKRITGGLATVLALLFFSPSVRTGPTPARYLAIHPPRGFSGISERVEDQARDQIEYPGEELWIRKRFHDELATRDLTSLMPEVAYLDRDYEWSYESKG